ncbi:MAG: formate dehydrogenase [Betaproteobacteria bacterium]
MRAIKQGDRPDPVTSEKIPLTRADLKRRRFLLALGAAGAGATATAVAARSITAGNVVDAAPAALSGDGGYAATQHVQTYYKTAKL